MDKPPSGSKNSDDDSAIIFKISSTNELKKSPLNLTEMALSLAMNLSGVERQYFYDAGAKDMYDAGEKLMKSFTILKTQEQNTKTTIQPPMLLNLHSKEPTNSITTNQNNIIKTVSAASPHSVSPSSTSSGFASEESEVIVQSSTTQAPLFNIRVPPPNTIVRHPITVQQSVEYSPPEHGGNANTSIMANYNNISTSVVQRLPPIGTKRSGSPIRTNISQQSTTNNNGTSPNSTTLQLPQQCTQNNENSQNNALELFGTNTIWSYTAMKPSQPKNQIIYGNRDILDLAGNISDPKWQFRPAQLPAGNTRMFFENRSQYHRLASCNEQIEDNYEECQICKFCLPTF